MLTLSVSYFTPSVRSSLFRIPREHCTLRSYTVIQPQGGTLIFSAYVGSDPASALHPKKISGISSTPKNI